MSKSLLEQLPKIVADGKAQAERILEGLEGRHRVGLQTREWVPPSRDTSESDWITGTQRQAHLDSEGTADWTNRLIYGDNLLAMAALLAGDEHAPGLRGKVDLIYIDPPFDSKADYRTSACAWSTCSGSRPRWYRRSRSRRRERRRIRRPTDGSCAGLPGPRARQF